MFENTTNSQGDLFKSVATSLSERKSRIFNDPNKWNNIFFREVVSQIKESIFSVLYDDRMGRPNASVRQLVGMMILKEGMGWTDAQLFDNCRFNMLVISALGQSNLDEDIPTEATYYYFRQKLHEYNTTHDDDLLKRAFTDITIKQMHFHGVKGDKIRMDSKLINSNIADCHRLGLVLETVRKCLKQLSDISKVEEVVGAEIYPVLEKLVEEDTAHILFYMKSKEQKACLVQLGYVVKSLILHYKDSPLLGEYYDLLRQLYEEQYVESSEGGTTEQKSTQSETEVNKEELQETGNKENSEEAKSCETSSEEENPEEIERSEVSPRPTDDISSGALQSVHDPDASFRKKGRGNNKQSVKGYHANITETCGEEDDLSLIVDVFLATANKSECDFFQSAIEGSEQLLQQGQDLAKGAHRHITEVITDGGYDSKDNRKYMVEGHTPTWKLSKMKGSKHSFDMKRTEEGQLRVWEKETGDECEVTRSINGKKVVVIRPDGQKRYYTDAQIKDYLIYQELSSQQSEESYNLRANVESTINHVFHRLGKSKKLRYRGKQESNSYVISRAFWVNLRRIQRKNIEKLYKTVFSLKNWMRSVTDSHIEILKRLFINESNPKIRFFL